MRNLLEVPATSTNQTPTAPPSSEKVSRAANGMFWQGMKAITWMTWQDSKTVMPIELLGPMLPGFLLLAHSIFTRWLRGRGAVSEHGAMELLMTAVETSWLWVLQRVPGPHPIAPDKVN